MQESLMSLAGAVLFILVGLVTLSAYSHPGTVKFFNQFLIFSYPGMLCLLTPRCTS
jgi:hypothetical protein